MDDCTNSPCLIVGDLNAPLPTQANLARNWYRSEPFTVHSLLLYDFLCTNNMYVGNFAFDKTVNYTYMKGNHRSYIDHVLLHRYVIHNLINCNIIEEIRGGDEWTSDHLPIRTTYCLSLSGLENGETISDTETQKAHRYPFVKWDDKAVQVQYEHKIATALENLPNIDMTAIYNSSETKRLVNMQCNKLNDIIHNASESVMFERPTNYRGRHRRVPWWSTKYTLARNRMQFWRGLWCNCDRVQHGLVFEFYKTPKQIYRQVHHLAMRTSHRNWFDQISYLY